MIELLIELGYNFMTTVVLLHGSRHRGRDAEDGPLVGHREELWTDGQIITIGNERLAHLLSLPR